MYTSACLIAHFLYVFAYLCIHINKYVNVCKCIISHVFVCFVYSYNHVMYIFICVNDLLCCKSEIKIFVILVILFCQLVNDEKDSSSVSYHGLGALAVMMAEYKCQ